MTFWYGTDPGEATFTSFLKDKKSENNRNQCSAQTWTGRVLEETPRSGLIPTVD